MTPSMRAGHGKFSLAHGTLRRDINMSRLFTDSMVHALVLVNMTTLVQESTSSNLSGPPPA